MPVGSRLLAGIMLALSIVLFGASPAAAETRSLKLYFIHTKEKAEITYKRNGRYISSGLQQINRFLRDWRRNEPTKMDPRLLDLIWEVYRASGSRDYIHVVSAYRSPATNSMLRKRSNGVAKKSQHMLGKAMDFYLPDVKLAKLRAIGLKMEVGGVGYYPSSGSPFVHMDVGNVRHWPRMNRKQLLAVFPDGKTIHVPSDGKPLPRYKQALAAYESRKRGGSTIQLASASETETRKTGGGFLTALFGGGADEEEDNGDTPAARPARAPEPAAPVVAVATPAPEPERPATPATIIAALPARSVPLPLSAPRPSVGLGEGVPVLAAAAPEAAEMQQPAVEEPFEVALGIPLPTRRPDYTAPEQALDGTAALALAAAAGDSVVPFGRPARDGETTEPTAALAAYVPLPGEKPSAKGSAMLMAALPDDNRVARRGDRVTEPLPNEAIPQPAPKTLRYASAGDVANPRKAVLARAAGTDPSAVVNGAVRTTQKSARPGKDDMRPGRKAIRVPVEEEVARWALYGSHVTRTAKGVRAPSMAFDAVREAPKVVYTAGFQHRANSGDLNRFSGNAVTFLSVAKFGTN